MMKKYVAICIKQFKYPSSGVVLPIIFYVTIFTSLIYAAAENSMFDVDFDQSMEFVENEIEKMSHSYIVELCRTIYNKNNLTKLAPKEKPIIPKIVHLIWVGPNTPPPVLEKCLESIKRYLPDWECKLWTDEDIPTFNLYNQEYYNEETNYGAKSDILRYEILYRFGGVYLDIDFEVLKSFDLLIHTYKLFTGLMSKNFNGTMANGIIGCIPGHPIIADCMESIRERRSLSRIIYRTGPKLFQESFYKIAKEDDSRVIAFPKSFFLPLEHDMRKASRARQLSFTKPESFTIHYWAGSWVHPR